MFDRSMLASPQAVHVSTQTGANPQPTSQTFSSGPANFPATSSSDPLVYPVSAVNPVSTNAPVSHPSSAAPSAFPVSAPASADSSGAIPSPASHQNLPSASSNIAPVAALTQSHIPSTPLAPASTSSSYGLLARIKSLPRPQLVAILFSGIFILVLSGFLGWFFLLRSDSSKLSASVRSSFWSAKKLQIGGNLEFNLPRPNDSEYYIKQIKTIPRILLSPTSGESYVNFSVGLIGSDNAAYSFAFNVRRSASNQLELTFVDLHAVIPILEKIKPPELLNLNRRTSLPLAKWAEKYNRIPLKIELGKLDSSAGFAPDLKVLVCALDRLSNLNAKKADLANLYNDRPFLALGKSLPAKSAASSQKTTDYTLKIDRSALEAFVAPLSSHCDFAPSKSVQAVSSWLDLGVLLLRIFSGQNPVALVDLERSRILGYGAGDHNAKQELKFIYDKFTLPERTEATSDWLPDLIQAYKNYQVLAASSEGDVVDDYVPIDKNCSVYQGVDPTDRCYKPGCGSSIEHNPSSSCLPEKR